MDATRALLWLCVALWILEPKPEFLPAVVLRLIRGGRLLSVPVLLSPLLCAASSPCLSVLRRPRHPRPVVRSDPLRSGYLGLPRKLRLLLRRPLLLDPGALASHQLSLLLLLSLVVSLPPRLSLPPRTASTSSSPSLSSYSSWLLLLIDRRREGVLPAGLSRPSLLLLLLLLTVPPHFPLGRRRRPGRGPRRTRRGGGGGGGREGRRGAGGEQQ